jgi:NmrA-like family
VATGKFNVTAITRADSANPIPSTLTKVKVDYNDPTSLSGALKGIDVLIITMAVDAPPDTQAKLLQAAADAKVPWVLPNEWGIDHQDEAVAKETLIGGNIIKARDLVDSLGVSSWIAVCCGFWYEYSLSLPPCYGFDFKQKKAIFFDKGTTRLNTSTWELCGKAVAKVLQLPITSASGPSLSDYKNGPLPISSFAITQRSILDSVHRVLGDKDEDWTIEYEDVKQRWADGMSELKQPEKYGRSGFAKLLYARLFYPEEPGFFEKRLTLANEVLGLPQEDFDFCTKRAIERAEATGGTYARP